MGPGFATKLLAPLTASSNTCPQKKTHQPRQSTTTKPRCTHRLSRRVVAQSYPMQVPVARGCVQPHLPRQVNSRHHDGNTAVERGEDDALRCNEDGSEPTVLDNASEVCAPSPTKSLLDRSQNANAPRTHFSLARPCEFRDVSKHRCVRSNSDLTPITTKQPRSVLHRKTLPSPSWLPIALLSTCYPHHRRRSCHQLHDTLRHHNRD